MLLNTFSLKEAERKVFRTTLLDGLWDIFIGAFFLQFGIAPLLSSRLGDFWSSAVFLPFWFFLLLLIWWAKKSVVVPRLGSVKFSATRRARLSKFTFIMLGINIISLIVGFFFALQSDLTLGLFHSAALGFMVLLLSSIAAHFLECGRFFIYGCLFFLSIWVGEWLFIQYKIPHHGFPITFGISAGIIILTGLTLFIRMLRQYPLPETESQPKDSSYDR